VQTEQERRKLGELDRELIEQRVRLLFDLRKSGHLKHALDFVAEDISFSAKGTWSAFPYTQPVRGKQAFGEALATIAIQYENLGSVIHDLFIDGECVAVRRTATLRHRGTGKVGDVDLADFLTFRDGLLAEFNEIVDAMALAQLDDG
jgi:ketosteroid isomerase-like protein